MSKLTYTVSGRMCVEAGAYLVNLASCSQCSNRHLVTRTMTSDNTDSVDSWDEDEEVEVVEDIQYSHVCGSCDHSVALHKVRSLMSDDHDNVYFQSSVQVLGGGGAAGVQDGVSALRLRRGQRLCHAARS